MNIYETLAAKSMGSAEQKRKEENTAGMTVRDLINALQKLPQNARVVAEYESSTGNTYKTYKVIDSYCIDENKNEEIFLVLKH